MYCHYQKDILFLLVHLGIYSQAGEHRVLMYLFACNNFVWKKIRSPPLLLLITMQQQTLTPLM